MELYLLMLEAALLYQKAFETYEEDASYRKDLGDSEPCYRDWCYVAFFVKLLRSFYEMTLRISGSLYVTSNKFFSEISELSCTLDDMAKVVSGNEKEKAIGLKMRAKFEKHWGDPKKMNKLIFFANILDPRDKLEFMPYQFSQLYGEEKGHSCIESVKSALNNLFADYVATHSVQPTPSSTV